VALSESELEGGVPDHAQVLLNRGATSSVGGPPAAGQSYRKTVSGVHVRTMVGKNCLSGATPV
jgi:hypothetical protein